LKSPYGNQLSEITHHDSRGKRLQVKEPKNIALIRSAQDWGDCQEEELSYYMENVHSTLIEGMNYICDNPIDTGCCCSRFSDEVDLEGNTQKRTFGFAYFLTLGHLEKWAEKHPTHLAIFGKFFEMAQHFNLQLDLKLWHEVSVLPGNHQLFEYVNCHSHTGLLPWFEVANVT